MNLKSMQISFGIAFVISLSGCAVNTQKNAVLTPGSNVVVRVYPDGKVVRKLPPSVAQKTQRFQGGRMVDVYWAALTESERRNLYSAVVLNTVVEQRNTNGSFSVAPVGAGYSKGFYRVTHEVFLGQQVACQPSNPNAGVVKMGVLLEVQILLESRKTGLEISNLVPLAAAVSDNKVKGNLSIKLWGFGANSGVLNSYLSPGGQLDMQSVTKAMEAIAVARAILEDKATVTTPYYIELTESSAGSCNGSPVVGPMVTTG